MKFTNVVACHVSAANYGLEWIATPTCRAGLNKFAGGTQPQTGDGSVADGKPVMKFLYVIH